MAKKSVIIVWIAIIIIVGLLVFFLLKMPGKSSVLSSDNSIFEDPANYVDAGNVTDRFAHYTSISRHTAKTDILHSPLFFNGYEVISVGRYEETEMYSQHVGVLTDSIGTRLILVNKSTWFEQNKSYEVTGIVKVVNYSSETIPVIWVENASEYISATENSSIANSSIINITNITIDNSSESFNSSFNNSS
jgi:hypothetical protein